MPHPAPDDLLVAPMAPRDAMLYDFAMGDQIKTTTARIDEPKALAAFLASMPNSAELGNLIRTKEPLNTRAYDDENETARFVISDGIDATCFTVIGITIDQAEMITVECEKSDAWSDNAFREAAAHVLE
jgi:hypothetical protein